MLVQNFTLHTHTAGFDGKNTAPEMIARACDLGFHTIGISNHFIVHPLVRQAKMYRPAQMGGYAAIYNESFDEAIAKFAPHYEQLRRLGDKYDVRVLRGMEVDYFTDDKWRRGFERALKRLNPDYLIGAVHFVGGRDALCNIHDIKNATNPDDQDDMMFSYWFKIGQMARSGMFNWIAHIDLPKKVGLHSDTEPWYLDANLALDNIEKSRSKIEINTSGFKRLGQPYPSPKLLEQVARRNIPVLISDDAHGVDDIGRNFDDAYQLAQKFGIKRFAQLEHLVRQK